jgi:hypothetical protein
LPFNVIVKNVADPALGPLLTTLSEAGYPNPVIEPATSAGEANRLAQRSASGSNMNGDADLPTDWHRVRELPDQSYTWPPYPEQYDEYTIYAGTTKREGTVHIALGRAPRSEVWGRERLYVIAFLTSGAPQIPLVEFLETDDFAKSGEMLAIIRGSDGGRRMYGPGDSLPDVYRHNFRTEMYNDRIQYSGAWRKVAVIAAQDDATTMLNHALVQARRRGDL